MQDTTLSDADVDPTLVQRLRLQIEPRTNHALREAAMISSSRENHDVLAARKPRGLEAGHAPVPSNSDNRRIDEVAEPQRIRNRSSSIVTRHRCWDVRTTACPQCVRREAT